MESSSWASPASTVLISTFCPSIARSWSIATTLKISVVATVSARSFGVERDRQQRGGGARIPAERASAHRRRRPPATGRSLSWPMVRAMMSRMAASVTKPRRTSRRPIGVVGPFCSASAMRSWSVVISPCWTSSSPSRSFFRCSAMTALRAQSTWAESWPMRSITRF